MATVFTCEVVFIEPHRHCVSFVINTQRNNYRSFSENIKVGDTENYKPINSISHKTSNKIILVSMPFLFIKAFCACRRFNSKQILSHCLAWNIISTDDSTNFLPNETKLLFLNRISSVLYHRSVCQSICFLCCMCRKKRVCETWNTERDKMISSWWCNLKCICFCNASSTENMLFLSLQLEKSLLN